MRVKASCFEVNSRNFGAWLPRVRRAEMRKKIKRGERER